MFSGMARVVKESHSFTRIFTHFPESILERNELALPAEAGPHLPFPEGWKAELVQAQQRWEYSLPKIITRRISQLLAV